MKNNIEIGDYVKFRGSHFGVAMEFFIPPEGGPRAVWMYDATGRSSGVCPTEQGKESWGAGKIWCLQEDNWDAKEVEVTKGTKPQVDAKDSQHIAGISPEVIDADAFREFMRGL